MLTVTSRRALLPGIPVLRFAGGGVTAGAMMRSLSDGLGLALEKSAAAGR
ncbi:hypothetical protein [Microvirga alba]|uniref:Uncharacterized protein n=1 Tax=Microvirga alba TaxID=2791025 RepID=A0A931FNX8_9HYPH|nr:hypothetical protein [Microvirga alba]MBF9234140.1 hypothetical protein [Microvirga alba]